MRPRAVEIDVDQDRSHLRPTLVEIPDEGKNSQHWSADGRPSDVRGPPYGGRAMGAIHAQLLDELGYDPDDGRPQLCDVIVPVGRIVAARDGARPVAAARLESGKLVVVDDVCPHDGGRISDGFVDGEHLVCARHGWALAPRNGRCERACKLRE